MKQVSNRISRFAPNILALSSEAPDVLSPDGSGTGSLGKIKKKPGPKPKAASTSQEEQPDRRKYIKSGKYTKAERQALRAMNAAKKSMHKPESVEHARSAAAATLQEQPQNVRQKRPYVKTGQFSKKHSAEKSPKTAHQPSSEMQQPLHKTTLASSLRPPPAQGSPKKTSDLDSQSSSETGEAASSCGRSNVASQGSQSNVADQSFLSERNDSLQQSPAAAHHASASAVAAECADVAPSALCSPPRALSDGESRSPDGSAKAASPSNASAVSPTEFARGVSSSAALHAAASSSATGLAASSAAGGCLFGSAIKRSKPNPVIPLSATSHATFPAL
jgi:hypothetical protein